MFSRTNQDYGTGSEGAELSTADGFWFALAGDADGASALPVLAVGIADGFGSP